LWILSLFKNIGYHFPVASMITRNPDCLPSLTTRNCRSRDLWSSDRDRPSRSKADFDFQSKTKTTELKIRTIRSQSDQKSGGHGSPDCDCMQSGSPVRQLDVWRVNESWVYTLAIIINTELIAVTSCLPEKHFATKTPF